jgi:hypothetical protein
VHDTATVLEIYSATLDWGRRGGLGAGRASGAPFVIETPSLRLPPLALSTSARGFPALASEMRSALADGIDTCVVLDARSLPAGVEILEAKELRSPDTGRANWDRLELRVPRAISWLGVSQPLLSADRRDAVVYVAKHCPLCGEGRYVWLGRDEDGRWRVRAHLTTWIS